MEITYDKSKVRVLIVDDESSIRDMLALTLKDDGWSVESASNGKEAIALIDQKKFHIVMSDINMPEVTGIELLEYVKKNHPHIEFLIMTSHATLETAVQAVKLGAFDYLNKPFDDLSIVPKKLQIVADKILLRQQNQELLKRLKTASQDLRRLVEVMASLSGILDRSELRDAVLNAFPKLYADETVKVSWWSRTAEAWQIASAKPDPDSFKGINFPDEAVEKLTELRNPRVHYFEYQNQRKDALVFECIKESLSDLFLQQISLCYQKACFHGDIASLVNKDGLTRIYNHRYFQERLRQEVSQAKRQKSFVSLILMDVDHFKNYNDTHGHPAGDELLRRLAEVLNKHQGSEGGSPVTKRETDIVARYGGEEFVMILPFTPHEGAKVKAERIREAVAAFPFSHREEQPLGFISLSIGVATFPDHAKTPAELIEQADRALYAAKRGGRNRVVSIEEVKDLPSASLQVAEDKKESAVSKPTLERILEEEPKLVDEAKTKPEELKKIESLAGETKEIETQKENKGGVKKSLRDLQEEKNPLRDQVDVDISKLVADIVQAVDNAEPVAEVSASLQVFKGSDEESEPDVKNNQVGAE